MDNEVKINGFNTKTIRYVTKYDVMKTLRECNRSGATAEEREFAIKSIPAVKVSRSKRLGKTFEKYIAASRSKEEICPHCNKSIDVYNCSRKIPKYCYCVYCGGALERPYGAHNPYFDRSILKENGIEWDEVKKSN